MGDNEPETGAIISLLSKTGDILLYSVTNISLASLLCLIYGDNALYIEMIISTNYLSSQRIEKKKRFLLQIQVNYHQFSKRSLCGTSHHSGICHVFVI